MQNKLIIRIILLFLLTTCLCLALKNSPEGSKQYQNNDNESLSNRQQILLRPKRATKKTGFFRTLFSVIAEQWTDTRNTIQKVNQMVNDNFLPDNAPVMETTTVSSDPNATTTTQRYRISRKEFNRILQRNLKGLIRLYNLELDDALKQSDKNNIEFRKNASIEVSKFL